MNGLVVDSTGFEVLAGGERIGPRRLIEPGDVGLLTGLAARYVRLVQSGSDDGVFIELGRELYGWLDGDQGQLTALLERAERPVVLEVRGPRSPSEAAWAVLRAPFELLAPPGGGFLAGNELDRFCVVRRLGAAQSRPPLDGFRLGLAFMASSPRGQHELDFEAEEAAILTAVGQSRIDLMVEDTGDPEQLAQQLGKLGALPVVHLSCHGVNNYPAHPDGPGVPVLMMEDEVGGGRITTAGDLVGLLTAVPRLLVVSACLTATGADAPGQLPSADGHKSGPGPGPSGLVAHSLATALVAAGMPAVVGWDGSVGDRAATLFAERLYRGLAGGADLVVAAGDAGRVLLHAEERAVRADWHLARVWLGPAGGGPVVSGTRKRSLISATHGTKTFLDRKHLVPVATAEMFVGRRVELQQALRALRAGERAGVLLRGQGRLGKSSLAARIADRHPGHAVAVVFGDYSALGILDAVATAMQANPAARQLIESRLPEVRARPEAIGAVLTDLLAGPCAQAGEDRHERPLLLIVDDLEQILAADPAGPHQLEASYAPVLAGVLRAFDPARTDSRLLVTSRFTFTLGGLEARLEDVQLRPLSEVAQRKLQRRQQAVTPAEQLAERAGLAGRAVAVSRGNPGLQDLIGLKLVYGEHVGVDRAEAAVTGMEAYLQQGGLPADAEVRAFLENLALDTLLEEAGTADVALLRAVTLFTLPVPEPVIGVLADQVGGSAARLRGLGLLDPYPDLHDTACLALAANPLAAGRLGLLDRHHQPLPLQLLRRTADAALTSGDGPAGKALLDRAAEQAESGEEHGTSPLDRARVIAEQARHLVTRGEPDQADQLFKRAHELFTAGGSELEAAAAMGSIADITYQRGDYDEALRIRREVTLPVYERLGDTRSAAVAWGKIADIAEGRGEYEEALRIRREVALPVYQRLGDTRSAAVTWGKIADIAFQQGNYEKAAKLRRKTLEAFKQLGDLDQIANTDWGLAQIDLAQENYEAAFIRLMESFQINSRLQRPDGIATVGMTLGRLLLAAGYDEQGRQVLGDSLAAATKIGWTGTAQQISKLLNPPDTTNEGT